MNCSYLKNEIRMDKNNEGLMEVRNISFIDLKIVKQDSVSIDVKYNLAKFKNLSECSVLSSVEKKRLLMKIIKTYESMDRVFKTNLKLENIYYDELLNVKFLKREFVENKNEMHQLMSLYAYLIDSINYDKVYKSEKFLIKKYKAFKNYNELYNHLSIMVEREASNNSLYFKLIKTKIFKRFKTMVIYFGLLILIEFGLIYVCINNFVIPLNNQHTIVESYVAQDYTKVIEVAKVLNIKQIKLYPKYLISVSSVRLSPLSDIQKENILLNLTPNTSENIFDYWINIAVEDYEQSLVLAKYNENLDMQALSYLLLIDSVKNDTELSNEQKTLKVTEYQEQLDAVNKQILGE